MERHKEICECIFCSSKCPKCQSININVDFDLKCSYNNGDVDSISINLGDVENLRLYCEDCDYDSDMDEDEELISKLINAIEDSLPKGWDCERITPNLPNNFYVTVDSALSVWLIYRFMYTVIFPLSTGENQADF